MRHGMIFQGNVLQDATPPRHVGTTKKTRHKIKDKTTTRRSSATGIKIHDTTTRVNTISANHWFCQRPCHARQVCRLVAHLVFLKAPNDHVDTHTPSRPPSVAAPSHHRPISILQPQFLIPPRLLIVFLCM